MKVIANVKREPGEKNFSCYMNITELKTGVLGLGSSAKAVGKMPLLILRMTALRLLNLRLSIASMWALCSVFTTLSTLLAWHERLVSTLLSCDNTR